MGMSCKCIFSQTRHARVESRSHVCFFPKEECAVPVQAALKQVLSALQRLGCQLNKLSF